MHHLVASEQLVPFIFAGVVVIALVFILFVRKLSYLAVQKVSQNAPDTR